MFFLFLCLPTSKIAKWVRDVKWRRSLARVITITPFSKTLKEVRTERVPIMIPCDTKHWRADSVSSSMPHYSRLKKKRNENVSIRKIRSNEPENRFPCGLTTDPFRNRSILGKIIIYESGDRSGGRIEKKKKEFEKFRSRAEKFKQINVTYDFFLLLFVIKLMTMIWKYFTEKLSENRKDSKK